ncbi:hypothetical protein N431DRAFT_216086 [Stipitochalara longipes BDJ]|nr:hypothetical protein N431DRAFT_216086 [Stipitochalara longipes BDJ]
MFPNPAGTQPNVQTPQNIKPSKHAAAACFSFLALPRSSPPALAPHSALRTLHSAPEIDCFAALSGTFVRRNPPLHELSLLTVSRVSASWNTNALMWRTFEAWDLLQMLLSDEIFLDAMMLPPFRASFQMTETTIIHIGGGVLVKKSILKSHLLLRGCYVTGRPVCRALLSKLHSSFCCRDFLNFVSGGKALIRNFIVLEGGPFYLV